MTLFEMANSLGAIITIGMGCMGFFAPSKASQVTGLSAVTKTAFAEFRATFGLAFILIGVIPLLTGDPMAYAVVGALWGGAAIGRIVSIILDKGGSEPRNWAAVFFEGGIGALLLIGSPFLNPF